MAGVTGMLRERPAESVLAGVDPHVTSCPFCENETADGEGCKEQKCSKYQTRQV